MLLHHGQIFQQKFLGSATLVTLRFRNRILSANRKRKIIRSSITMLQIRYSLEKGNIILLGLTVIQARYETYYS